MKVTTTIKLKDMKRLARIESKGYNVVMNMNGNGCFAVKGNIKIKGTSVTNLHIQIFGY